MLSGEENTGSQEVEDVVDSTSTKGPSELLPLPVERQAEDRAGDGGSHVGPDNDWNRRVDCGVGGGHQANHCVGCDLPRKQFELYLWPHLVSLRRTAGGWLTVGRGRTR